MPNPVAVPIVLTDDEREQLRAWERRPSSAQALALRSRIVLACADAAGESNTQIAQRIGIARHTVTKWRNGSPSTGSRACWTSRDRAGPHDR